MNCMNLTLFILQRSINKFYNLHYYLLLARMLALGVIDVGGSQSARRKRTCPSGRSPYPFKYNRSGGMKAKRTHKKTNKHKPLRRHKWLQVMITRRIKFNFWTFTCIYKTLQYEIHHYDSTIYKFLVKILLWYK